MGKGTTGLDIEAAVRDLIVSVVGDIEATNIDIDLVSHDRQAGVLDVGDQAWDGCVTVSADDAVTVWAQGYPHTTETVAGAWDHFAAKADGR